MAISADWKSEITLAIGGASRKFSASGTTAAAGDDYDAGTQLIATAGEQITVKDTGAIGWVWIRNLDGTNYCDFGPDTTNVFVRVKPNEAVVFYCASSALYGKANSAAVRVEYVCAEV